MRGIWPTTSTSGHQLWPLRYDTRLFPSSKQRQRARWLANARRSSLARLTRSIIRHVEVIQRIAIRPNILLHPTDVRIGDIALI